MDLPFNPRFQGTWIVSEVISAIVDAVNKAFNPRFQGTWIVSHSGTLPATFATTTFQSPFSGDMDC